MAASSSDQFDRPNTGWNPPRKVRVVAKIRAFTDVEFESLKGVSTTPWISAHKPKGELSERVAISFGNQSTSRKETYEADYCYEQHEDNCLIFAREIKPLISGVFDGCNSSVIAYGARGSGKTYTIQGSAEKPGLAVLAMAEILSMAEEVGKSVTISYYEVYQDHVYDLLDPKRPTVLVLEDAQGKIQLKGLSQVSVKSISEFQKLYVNGCGSHKPTQKIAFELPKKSHKGLMVHVSSCNDNLNTHLVGNMNFVDLAGYEDARRKSSDGSKLVESTRINKSLYALQNVVYALNTNESHVPYRESKLTRMLQSSLGGTNRILMITCLNPSFCQDTIYMVSLASRACQGINRVFTDSTKKTKISTRPTMLSSSKIVKHMNVSASVKKQTGSRLPLLGKKPNGAALVMKGRKLFDEANHLKSSKQANSSSNFASAIIPFLQEEEKSISNVSNAIVPLEKELLSSIALKDIEPTSTVEKGISLLVAPNALDPPIAIKDVSLHSEDNHPKITPSNNSSTKALTFLEEGHNIDKENKSSLVNEGGSPPISEKLRELSNLMKSLYSSTPSWIKVPQEDDTILNDEVSTNIVEPKTPALEKNLRVNDKVVANINSPWETFNMRSSRMKKSLVQEYLQFLNSASKEELKGLKGIGDKRATYILELREESPEPFKNLDDLKDIGLSAKQIKGMMKKVAGEMFS